MISCIEIDLFLYRKKPQYLWQPFECSPEASSPAPDQTWLDLTWLDLTWLDLTGNYQQRSSNANGHYRSSPSLVAAAAATRRDPNSLVIVPSRALYQSYVVHFARPKRELQIDALSRQRRRHCRVWWEGVILCDPKVVRYLDCVIVGAS